MTRRSQRSYTSVPGSAALQTQAIGENSAHDLEMLDTATPVGKRVAGQWLARTSIRSDFIPVLGEVFDRLALEQEAEEQAVYGHLYRLALAEERNYCRVSRRELSLRTRLSDRRLGKALAGLAKKNHIALVERDRRGTLYRIFLPYEVFGEAMPSAVFAVREKVSFEVSTASDATANDGEMAVDDDSTAGEGEAKVEDMPGPLKGYENNRVSRPMIDDGLEEELRSMNTDFMTLGGLVAAFIEETKGAYKQGEIVEEILNRMEGGRTLADINIELMLFANRAPKNTPLRDLTRFLNRK